MDIDINFVEKNSIGIQTESYETFDINELEFETKHFFKHLSFANQSYFQHFCDAIKYSFMSFKASFCFFVHSIWPDIYIKSGSEIVHELSGIIKEKYTKRIKELIRKGIKKV